jgi:hypothetical protein
MHQALSASVGGEGGVGDVGWYEVRHRLPTNAGAGTGVGAGAGTYVYMYVCVYIMDEGVGAGVGAGAGTYVYTGNLVTDH